MAKSTNAYQDNRNALAGLLKKNADSPLPIQEVRPVEPKKEMGELARISSMWLPTTLVKAIKVHAAESGKSLKEISIEAYEQYLATRK